jgi:hypothetical protein
MMILGGIEKICTEFVHRQFSCLGHELTWKLFLGKLNRTMPKDTKGAPPAL